MRDKKKFLIAAFAWCLLGYNSQGQQVNDSLWYRQNPVWINMIDDPHVNYFDAVKAFEIFWQDKERPVETDEVFNNKEDHPVQDGDKDADAIQLADAYRKFVRWKFIMQPFVTSTGQLLTSKERIEIWRSRK